MLAMGLFGCNGEGGGIFGGAATDPSSGDDIEVPAGAADETLTSDLSDGTTLSDLDWAHDSEIACWVESEDINFGGAHVFFEIDKEGSEDVFVRATPDDDTDVSLYTLEFSGAVETPPDVTSPTRCEAAFDASTDSNPGGKETIELQGFGDRILLIGVAGANDAVSGTFTVDVWKEAGEVEDETGE
jgi:hypothetical protein